MNKQVTIKEIARWANLSIGTVDRVLHGRGRVSKETEQTIQKIIHDSGYKPNIHARDLSLKASYEFGVIIPHSEPNSDYWEILKKGIDRATETLASYNVHQHFFFFNRYVEASFLNAGSKALEQKMVGLIIAPVLVKACRTFVASIPPEIPYVYVDSDVPDTAPLAFIGQDSFKSGVCGAQLMQKLVGDKSDVTVLRMLPDDFHIDRRVMGFHSFFDERKSIGVHEFKVNGRCTDNEFAEQVKSIAEKVPECKGIFVTNAAAYRVVKALQLIKCSGMRIIGYDCIEQNRRLLNEGYIDFIISQNTEQQGYMGIETLFRHLVLEKPCVSEVRMPINIVIAGNLSDY